jgi:hypothetical protein
MAPQGRRGGPQRCHRCLVSAWFKDMLGINVPELGQEHAGCGWSYPKLPPTCK